MKVKDICRRDFETIAPEASLAEAARKMRDKRVDQLTVATEAGWIGVVSGRDILARAVARSLDPDSTAVESVMNVGIPCCGENDGLERAAGIMREKRIRELAVLDAARRILGVVRLDDVARGIDDSENRSDLLLTVCR